MSYGAVIYGRLTADASITALVGTDIPRIYPLQRAQGDNGELPAITYQRISSDHPFSQDGWTGLAIYRVQLNCRASTWEGADALAALVKKDIKNSGPLVGYRGSTNTGGVTVQECYIDDERDDREGPADGTSKAVPVVQLDLVLTVEEA